MTDHERLKRQEVINCLKLEVEILCEGMHGAAYNAVWEDHPRFSEHVTWELDRVLNKDKKENPNAYV